MLLCLRYIGAMDRVAHTEGGATSLLLTHRK